MPTDLFANNATTAVSSAQAAVAAGTSESWTVSSSAGFPVANNATGPATQFSIVDPAAPSEMLRVTNVSGTTWTVIRGVEGTTPVAHAAGFTVAQVVTSATMRQLYRDIDRTVAMRRFNAAVADVANNPVDVMCIGGSFTEGANSTTLKARWVDQFRDQIRALVPVPGVNGGQNYLPVSFRTASLPVPMTIAGSPAAQVFGLGERSYALTTTSHIITATVIGTSVRIHYTRDASAGIGSYSIDGATAVPFNCATGNMGRTDTQAYVTVTFATRGTHTVQMRWVSGGLVNIEGLAIFDGDETKGVRVWEDGYYGYQANTIANSLIAAGPARFADRITSIQPALVTLEFGGNDALNGRTAAQAKADLLTIIATIKAACTIPPSILIIAPYQPNASTQEPWTMYVQAMTDIAYDDSAVAILDLTAPMPPVGGDVLGLYSDSVHPSSKGHIALGAIIANYLTLDQKIASTLRRVTSRLTAAATSSAVAYASTGLSVTLEPNTAYTFRATGQYRTAAATTGVGLRVNTSATVTGIRYNTVIWGAATSASTPTLISSSANQGANLTASVVAAATDYMWEIEGTIRVGAAGGTLAVEFASEVAASTVTIQPDSSLYADPA